MDNYSINRSVFDIKLTKFNLFILLLLSAILSPEINIISGFPVFRAQELIIYIFFPFLFFINYFHFNNFYRVKTIVIILVFLLFSYTISIAYSYIFLQIDYGYRDFFEYIKVLKWIAILILASEIDFDDDKLSIIINVLFIIYFIVFLFAILQFFNLFNISYTVGKFFSPEYHLASAMGMHKRVTSVAGGPNSLGALCSTGNLFFLSMLFNSKKDNKKIILLFFGYFITLITIFLTSSRTSVFSILFVSFVFFIFTKIKIRYKIIFSVLIIIVFFLILPNLTYFNRITEKSYIIKLNSFVNRIRMWREAFVDIKRSPIFGNGIAKKSMRTWVDNAYVLFLRRIGIFGMMFWILFYLSPLFSIKSKYKDISWYISMVILFVSLFNITANHFSDIKLIDSYLLLIGMSLSILNRKKLLGSLKIK